MVYIRSRNRYRNRNRNLSEVGTGTVINNYGSATLFKTQVGLPTYSSTLEPYDLMILPF
jgi:hypothetical protein